MKRFAVFTSFLLLAVSLSVAETPVERYGQLAVKGNRLVSKSTGKPVQLRGMSYFWSMAGEARDYYNADVVNTLVTDWKINVIRAAMGVDEKWNDVSQGYLAGDKSGSVSNKKRVFDVADAAIAKGIYFIVDWHSHTANDHTNEAKVFFEEMATKYKDKPNVIYEIFNEPINGGTGVSSANYWGNTVKPYSQTIVNAIRAIDPNNVIIIGTPTWSQDVDIATANPVEGEHLVYSLHFYSLNHKEPIRTKGRTALSRDKAIFVSEFGVCGSGGSGDLALDEATKWLNFLDSNKVSWVNWSICNKAETASALKPGTPTNGIWTDANITESGKYVRGKLIEAYNREESNTATLVTDLVVPNAKQPNESTAIAPVAAVSNIFSVGPVPASQSGNGVKFFWQGKAVAGGSLLIYDALGNSVKTINVTAAPSGNLSKRTIGSWDLTDANGRRAAAGSYLVKGKVVTQNGNAVIVSSMIVVGN